MKPRSITAGLLALVLALGPICSLGEAETTPEPTLTPPIAETAQASEITEVPESALGLEEKGMSLGIHSVYYPQVNGMADEAMQEAINAKIISAGDIEELLVRLAVVMSLETPLQATWQGTLTENVLSCAMSARGPIEDTRTVERWSSVNIDLTTGEEITFADLFLDEAAARAAIEAYLWDVVAPELSAHLERSELTPIPDCFSMNAQGLTLCYPMEQLSTLSGRAGTVTILWYELRDYLKLGEGTVLRRIGAEASVTLNESSVESIAACVAQGALPGLPVHIGDDMSKVIEKYRRLFDPDLYEGGRMFTLEDGAFRQVYILTDALSEKSVEGSVVQGIRADRLNLYGLCTGETTLKAWREVLGEPEATVALDAERAESYRLECGTSDYYPYGSYRLRLHADETGVLRHVFLIP